MVKNPPANAGDMGLIPGTGRFPGEGNGNPSSILAWDIPWTKEPGGLQSMGLKKQSDSVIHRYTFFFIFFSIMVYHRIY